MSEEKGTPAEIIHALWRKHIHKLNNSLAAIIGHSTLLSYDIPDDENMRGFLRNIREATREAIRASDVMGELEEALRPTLDMLPPETADYALELLTHGSVKQPSIELTPPDISDFHDYSGVEHILLVEDDEQLRMLLIDCLKDLGYTVDVAENGRVAKEKFDELEDEIDLVCVDFHLPFANGLEVVQHIRKQRPRLRVILLSGAPINPEAPDIQEARFSSILSKPLEITDFAKTIRYVLNSPIRGM